MTTSPRFKVVSTGKIINGFDPETVQGNLLTRLRLKPEHAAQFFNRSRVLKKNLTQAEADKFCKGLSALGIEVEATSVDPPAPKPTPQPLRDTAGFEPEQEIPPLYTEEPSLSLVEDDASSRTSRDMIECPNCGHFQEKSEQCESCGIFFHKWEAAATQNTGRFATQTATGLRTSTSVTSAASSTTHDNASDDEWSFNILALIAATLAAVGGAWVWQFVAITFGYEIGWIAWGIGAAIALAAILFGANGENAATICALLFVGSMALGKYWSYDTVLNQLTHDPETYEFLKSEARPYSRLDGSETSLRQFIFDYGYTEATSASRVSSADIKYFRELVEPQLLIAANTSNYDEFIAAQNQATASANIWSVIWADLKLIDALFLMLGVGTAFGMVARLD